MRCAAGRLFLRVQKHCYFAGGGHGGLGATAGYGYCGDGRGVAGGLAGIFAGEQAYGEAGVEGVACGGGVHGFYCEGWNHFADAVGGSEVGALRAHFDYYIFGSACEEEVGAAGGGGGSDWLRRGKAAEDAGFAFVGSDPGYDLEQS